ncbi:nucleotidyltransferase [Methanosarcinales archaeon]|nr:MAG: nucleotidyltransferase [Methanosarcinales archaeon]
MPNKKEVIDEIEKIISEFDYVSIAYVFGSYIHNDDFNDIDVALLISNELDPYTRFKFEMQVARELERRIKPRFEFDVKILNHAPIEFQYEVLKKGKAVFVRDRTENVEYESETISNYLDFQTTAEYLNKKFLARV